MKLKVGMYVRTHVGRIERIKTIEAYNWQKCINGHTFSVNIIKASNNIIDLIEVGDIITFKNDNDVYKVNCIPNEKTGCEYFYLEFDYEDKFGVEDIEISQKEMEIGLESIVTKEQFDSVKYEVSK